MTNVPERTWKGPTGVRYRRYWRDSREYFEQTFADGAVRTDEITPELQRLFDRIADAKTVEELRRLGIPILDQDAEN